MFDIEIFQSSDHIWNSWKLDDNFFHPPRRSTEEISGKFCSHLSILFDPSLAVEPIQACNCNQHNDNSNNVNTDNNHTASSPPAARHRRPLLGRGKHLPRRRRRCRGVCVSSPPRPGVCVSSPPLVNSAFFISPLSTNTIPFSLQNC